MLRIYLAGGFHSGWQDAISSALAEYECLDPSQHHIEDPAAYTAWDLAAIRRCDVVLANMEASNPGGYSLALEVGFAKALGKFICFVDGTANTQMSKYFEMIRQCSDVVVASLDDALIILRRRSHQV